MTPSTNAGSGSGVTGAHTQANENKVLAGFTVLVLAALAAGVALLITGLAMHSHNQALTATCHSGLGEFGQAVDSQAASMCSHATLMSDLGIGLVIAGVVVGLWGIRNLAVAIVGITSSGRPSVRS
jgi:hypothetical protein